MQKAPGKPAGSSLDQHLLMGVDAAPASLGAAEQPEPIIGIPAAPVPPASEVMHEPGNVESVDAGRPVGELVLDFRAQLGRYALVGVEVQDPLEPHLIERELLLLAVSRPIADE